MKRERPQPVMNVTPLVDVVLVLLIIFMVVLPMLDKNPNVQLPEMQNADEDPKSKTDPFTLSLTRTGDAWFEEEALASGQLEGVLRAASAREPSRRLVLRADRDTPYRHVRSLLKVTQQIGFPGIAMHVQSREPKE